MSILLCPPTVVVCNKLFDKFRLVNFIFPLSIKLSKGLKSLILLLFKVNDVRFFRLAIAEMLETLLLFKFKVVNFVRLSNPLITPIFEVVALKVVKFEQPSNPVNLSKFGQSEIVKDVRLEQLLKADVSVKVHFGRLIRNIF